MIARTLSLVSIGASVLILVAFALFAVDEARSSSERQQATIGASDGPAKTAAQDRASEERSSVIRRTIDDGSDALLSPFSGLADAAGSEWARRGVPALLGLLLYGFGIGMLSRMATGLP